MTKFQIKLFFFVRQHKVAVLLASERGEASLLEGRSRSSVHTIQMATDEPTSAAAQQDLSGSNTGHLTVTYDFEDASYCSRVDKLVRAIESMPFVSKLSQLGGPRRGFGATLKCYAARGYNSCRRKQANIVFVTQQRTTSLACLQDLLQQLQASHGQNCIDAAHALAREKAHAAAASRPPAPGDNAMASMMHAAGIRTRLELATKRAADAHAACLAAEKERDAAQLVVQQLERELHACCKRARTAEQDDEPAEAAADWNLSTFRAGSICQHNRERDRCKKCKADKDESMPPDLEEL